ncbi:hypothetical protein KFU94_70005 [Chloroflexi bacterium TSY]|nr:hypothetical protein [Chloroflexi bacterium TSY]
MPLLNVIHYSQRYEADCLAACARMVLEHIGIRVSLHDLSHKKASYNLLASCAG